MSGLRILVLDAAHGAGETTNAHELADELHSRPEVSAIELTHELPGLPQRLGLVMTGLAVRLGRDGLAPAINAFGPHVVVSFDPESTAVLGGLRASGRFPIPLVSAVADIHQLQHDAQPGVDRYLVPWPASAAEAEAVVGAGRVAVVAAPVDEHFRDAPAHSSSRGWVARQLKLSLKGGRPLVIVAGGSAGRGDLAGAAVTALEAVPEAAVLIVAGENAHSERDLSATFTDNDRVRVIGTSDRIATLMAAANVLIDTAGAGTMEAALVGCPVLPAGGQLASALPTVLAAERPEPLDMTGVTSAADVVVAVAYGPNA